MKIISKFKFVTLSAIMSCSILVAQNAMAQHETHGPQEPSPRTSKDIIKLMLDSSDIAEVYDAATDLPLAEGISELFSDSLANTDSSAASRTIKANCRFIGTSDMSDRDESCFVTISDSTSDLSFFRFVYSAMSRETSDFVFSKAQR